MAAITRREAIGHGGAAAVAAAFAPELAAAALETAPAPIAEAPPDPGVHLLRRATYGVSPDEIERLRTLGREAWLEQQLAPAQIDDSAVEDLLHDRLPTLSAPLEDLVRAARADPEARFEPLRELQIATLVRAISSRRQLEQVMVEFWSDHFSVYAFDGPMPVLKPYDDRAVIRPHAMGSFRDLLQADARSPAMLYYLDNVANVAAGPNENYARELLELHTLGIDGGYTERDVQETARIFTGWTLDPETGAFRFVAARHDFGAKRVLGVDYPAGHGLGEGEALLDHLAAHPATARHLAHKLAVRFVADEAPPSLVGRLAAAFEASAGHIPTVLGELFRSEELAAAADAKLARPFDYLVAVIRATGARLELSGYRLLYEVLDRLGQVPFRWPSPDGYPMRAAYWTATSTLLTRWNFGLGLAEHDLDGRVRVPVNRILGGARTPAEIVAGLEERVLGRAMTAADRATISSAAAFGRPTDQPLPASLRRPATRLALGLILVSRYLQQR